MSAVAAATARARPTRTTGRSARRNAAYDATRSRAGWGQLNIIYVREATSAPTGSSPRPQRARGWGTAAKEGGTTITHIMLRMRAPRQRGVGYAVIPSFGGRAVVLRPPQCAAFVAIGGGSAAAAKRGGTIAPALSRLPLFGGAG